MAKPLDYEAKRRQPSAGRVAASWILGVLGGFLGAPIGYFVGFVASYAIVKFIVWWTGDEQLMHLMWFGMATSMLTGLFGILLGAAIGSSLAGDRAGGGDDDEVEQPQRERRTG